MEKEYVESSQCLDKGPVFLYQLFSLLALAGIYVCMIYLKIREEEKDWTLFNGTKMKNVQCPMATIPMHPYYIQS